MEKYFRIRKYDHGDAAHVVSLYARMAAKDSTINAISNEDWERFILLPQNKRGEGFRLAILSNDSAIGISMSSLRDHSEGHIRHFRILVEPTHRRHGIGAALLQATAEIEKEISGSLQTVCSDEWTAAVQFYERLTFTVVDNELEMVLALSDTRQLTAESSRWLIREEILSAELSSALADIHNEAYADSRSFVRVNAQTFPNLLSERAHLWVARDGEEVIGYCHVEDAEPDRWLESVAVKRHYQRRRVATSLLKEALKSAPGSRPWPMRLSVRESNTAALATYRRLGFQTAHSSRRYVADRQEVLRRLFKLGSHRNELGAYGRSFS